MLWSRSGTRIFEEGNLPCGCNQLVTPLQIDTEPKPPLLVEESPFAGPFFGVPCQLAEQALRPMIPDQRSHRTISTSPKPASPFLKSCSTEGERRSASRSFRRWAGLWVNVGMCQNRGRTLKRDAFLRFPFEPSSITQALPHADSVLRPNLQRHLLRCSCQSARCLSMSWMATRLCAWP